LDANQVSVPKDKQDILRTILEKGKREPLVRQEVESLAGRLQWIAQIAAPLASAFTRGFFELKGTLADMEAREGYRSRGQIPALRLTGKSSPAKWDTEWWSRTLAQEQLKSWCIWKFSGSAIRGETDPAGISGVMDNTSVGDLSVSSICDVEGILGWSSDASSTGIGVVIMDEWWTIKLVDIPALRPNSRRGWTRTSLHRASDGIFIWELIGALAPIFVACHGVDEGSQELRERLSQRILVAWTDNQAVAHAITSGRSRNKVAATLLRFASLALQSLNSILISLWCPREENQLADHLSKLDDPSY
jgi:hypothetical protein